jgi:UDPglucose--hexose-1-phosphate uridylyltransferase
MSERRWNPFLREWVTTATHRQERTFLPPDDYCPLCPTQPGGFQTEVPRESFEFVVFQNRFPSLQMPPPSPAVQSLPLMPVAPAEGICEVVLYTSRHSGTLTDASVDEIERLIYVWADRSAELGRNPRVQYVFIFENKGKEIGVTLTHPHGQIFGYPFIPPIAQRELASAAEHYANTNRNLFADVLEAERADGRRLVCENADFYAGIPFYAKLPYELHLTPKSHVARIEELSPSQRRSLAQILKESLERYDRLFGFSLPYVMAMHQAPSDGLPHPEYTYHIEFYPPHRTRDKLKYLAGSEVGMGAFITDTLPEECAEHLRTIPW